MGAGQGWDGDGGRLKVGVRGRLRVLRVLRLRTGAQVVGPAANIHHTNRRPTC